ncbi:C40 family peptidase [Mycobacterium kansasii]
MKSPRKTTLAVTAAIVLAAITAPIAIIAFVITPTSAAYNPAQQLNECDAHMRATGMVAQNAPPITISGPNADNNAQVIVAVGEKMHIPPQGIIVAEATALTESGLKNYANDGTGKLAGDQHGIEASLQLPHDAVGHDHGSLGIMQQQFPWWGTIQELMTPAIAARKFYEALLKVPNWQNLPVTVAAQAVQGSALPDAYAQWEPRARALYAAYRGAGGTTSDADAAALGVGAALPAGPNATAALPAGMTTLCDVLKTDTAQQQAARANPDMNASEAGVRAVRAAQSQIGLPYVWGGGGPNGPTGGGFDCSGLTSYAIYQASGKVLPRQTYGQVNAGIPVPDASQILPGDLVLSNFSERGPEHVQLYAGGGQVVEAQDFGVPVKMSPFPRGKVIIRRVL